jgi:hypothetical protein
MLTPYNYSNYQRRKMIELPFCYLLYGQWVFLPEIVTGHQKQQNNKFLRNVNNNNIQA